MTSTAPANAATASSLLTTIDWAFIGAFFVLSLAIGLGVARKAGDSVEEFFLSGRNMPWWLLGVSMVATTFSADTPNLVADIVRQNGVAGNWVWWAFLLTGMLTVFVYAKLWRRSEVITDIEFYELRYSGRAAAFLRGFRAVYLGLFFNVMIMASVSLAAIKIGAVLLGFSPLQTLLIASLVTVAYSALGGLRGVMITDFVQFALAMGSSVAAAYLVVTSPRVGGLDALLTHPALEGKLGIFPDFAHLGFRELLPIFILPLAVQWWSVWYPGSEPGGGGYVVQRVLAAKDEQNAVGATLLFNAAHYALRPWPWILVALSSLVVFPTIDSIAAQFPHVPTDKLGHDLAYPAMLTLLPSGLLGLIVASLIAAYMSTISTQLNWGSSYLVNDFYRRFVDREAEPRRLVAVGRVCTVVLMALSAALALVLESALDTFQLLLQIGAGTGLLFILRWFWWRINAWSEVAAMTGSFAVAVYSHVHERIFGEPLAGDFGLLLSVLVTTVIWVAVTLVTKPTDETTLRHFVEKARPGGPGWKAVRERAAAASAPLSPALGRLPIEIACMVAGTLGIYSALFATGLFIYGNVGWALGLTVVAGLCATYVFQTWGRLDGGDDHAAP